MHTMDSITGLLILLLLYVCYKWSDSADRHCTTKQRWIRAEGRIADLQDQLRCRHADIERLESQVSALSYELTDAQTGPGTMQNLQQALLTLEMVSPVSCQVSITHDAVCHGSIYAAWNGRCPGGKPWSVRERINTPTRTGRVLRPDPAWEDEDTRYHVLSAIHDTIRATIESETPAPVPAPSRPRIDSNEEPITGDTPCTLDR
jgi:hypothetical protein